MEKKLAVAVVTRPHGIRGQVKLKPLTDNPSSLLTIDKIYIGEHAHDAHSVTKSWQYKNEVCMEIDGITTRDDAEKLRGKYLYIAHSELPPLDDGQHYVDDLIGCVIVDENKTQLGKLKDILQHGAADVYVVEGNKNFMMPSLKRVIKEVDIGAKIITVDSRALSEVIVYEN